MTQTNKAMKNHIMPTFRSFRSIFFLSLLLVTLQINGQPMNNNDTSLKPWDLQFKLQWKKRFVFDAELPLPEGITFLPYAHYVAEVTSLPAEMLLKNKDGDIRARITAPDNIAPPFTFHVCIGGSFATYVTKDGKTTLAGFQKWAKKTDFRQQHYIKEMVMHGNGGISEPKGFMTAGAGQADVRFVTKGRENAIYFEDGRMFFTFSMRGGAGCLGVASFNPAKFDVRLEGIILFDYGDNLLRNDVAAHLFHDEEAGEWRAWVSNFGSGGPRAPGGINVAWCKENPLHGLNFMKSKSLGLTDMHEDPSGIWDPQAKKWRLYLCKFFKGIKGQMFESDHWDGPYVPITQPVPEDSTGTTIQWMNGTRYCFSGSAEHALYVYSYPDLKKLGKLQLDMEPWGNTPLETPWGIKKTTNSRIWPCFAELPDGFPFKYILLTMDRINIPGWPDPNWTYGGLYIYGANPPN